MAAALFILRPSLQHLSTNAYPKSLGLFVKSPMVNQIKTIANDARSPFRKASSSSHFRKARTLRERFTLRFRALEKIANNNVEKVCLASTLGLGALCYVINERSKIWPQNVKDRMESTFSCLGESIVISCISSEVVILLWPMLSNLMARIPLLATAAIFSAMVVSLNDALSLPYSAGSFDGKHWAWITHFVIIGAVCAPFLIRDGPLVRRAAWWAAGFVGGFSTLALAVSAPEKLYIQGEPLAVAGGCGAYIATYLGYKFSVPGGGLRYVATCGLLVLLGVFLFHETREIEKRAAKDELYDPINESIGLFYRYTPIGIIINFVTILAEERRKKLSVM